MILDLPNVRQEMDTQIQETQRTPTSIPQWMSPKTHRNEKTKRKS